MRAEFASSQQDRGLGHLRVLFASQEQSTVRCVHLLLTLRHPITQISHPALRTWATVSESAIFLTLAEMFVYEVHCTARVSPSRRATMSIQPNRSLRMFAPGTQRSTTSASQPSSRRSFRVRWVGVN
jgi:DNA-binding IclR family transcriptional regulator